MLVQSFLVQGSGAGVASRISSLLSSSQVPPLDALVLFSLGADHPTLLQSLEPVLTRTSTTSSKDSKNKCSCYLTESYGILGFDDDVGRNIELMEKGRGSEYGFSGGLGGQGCLVVGYQGVVAGHQIQDLPTNHNNGISAAGSIMVIADSSSQWAKDSQKVKSKLPLQYGGISKSCWRCVVAPPDSDASSTSSLINTEQVPYFWIADVTADQSPTGVTIFADEEDGTEATQRLLSKIPTGFTTTSVIHWFISMLYPWCQLVR